MALCRGKDLKETTNMIEPTLYRNDHKLNGFYTNTCGSEIHYRYIPPHVEEWVLILDYIETSF